MPRSPSPEAPSAVGSTAADADGGLRRIIECLADAVVVVDRDGRVQFANPAAAVLFGRPGQELVGGDFGFPLVGGEATEVDLADGRVAEMRVVELVWDGRPAWLASLRDLTARREAEEAARRLSRERAAREAVEDERGRLEKLLLRAPAATLSTRGPDHVCVFLNPVMERLLGGRALLGRSLASALGDLRGHPFLAGFDEVMRSGAGRRRRELEVSFTREDGADSTRCLDVTWEPLAGRGGVDGVMCFAHDLTDHVRTRRELEKAMEKLRVEEKRKDQFMAVLGHELRNPLAGIVGGLRLLEVESDADRRAWTLAMMQRQSSLLTSLLDDLLDVSRVARGKLELRRAVVALRDIVEAAAAATSRSYEQKGQALVLRLPPEPVPVDVDPARFQQVMANLLGNASKYSERGREVRLSAWTEGTEAVVAVADEGVGIAADMLEEIFEPFIQGQGADGSPLAGGLGIGLTIVKQLIELHGGRVSASSPGPGRGSTFTVRVPRAAAVPAAPEPGPAAPPAGRRVLVVDDNADAATVLADMLAAKGCRADTAFNAGEATAQAMATAYDAILLDLDMPEVSGYELAQSLRARLGPDVVIFAISGFGHADARERSWQCGIDHHFVKPADADELLRLVGAVCASRSTSASRRPR